MVAFTLLMGISLTSCLNSGDSESAYDWAGYVLIDNYMGMVTFTDMGGNKLYPSAASISQIEGNNSFKVSDYKLAIVYVKLVDNEATAKSDEVKKYNVNLVAFQGCQYDKTLVAQTKEDMETLAPETAPVTTLSIVADNYGNKTTPYLISKDIVVLPIAWTLEKLDKSIVEQHKLKLVACMDDIESGSNELVLYLRHDKGTDDKTDKSYAGFYGYNITEALDGFVSKVGAKPSTIVIKSHETGVNGGKDMPAEYTTYTIEYKIDK